MITPEAAGVALLVAILAYLAVRAAQLLSVKSEYSLGEKLLYAPAYTLARLLWRVRVAGGKKIVDLPIRGGVILANHRCSLDPFFVQLAAGRRVHWMVASEYFKNPIFGFGLKLFQAIPTTRSGSDNAATKRTIALASQSRLVGMFPEGRLNKTPEPLLPVRPGALLVAKRAKTSIIPLWIDGAPRPHEVWRPFFMTAKVTVYVGTPYEPPEDEIEASRSEQSQLIRDLLLSAAPAGREV